MLWVVSAVFFMFILLAELDVRPLGRGGAFEVPGGNLSIDRFGRFVKSLSIDRQFDSTRTERIVEQGHGRALR